MTTDDTPLSKQLKKMKKVLTLVTAFLMSLSVFANLLPCYAFADSNGINESTETMAPLEFSASETAPETTADTPRGIDDNEVAETGETDGTAETQELETAEQTEEPQAESSYDAPPVTGTDGSAGGCGISLETSPSVPEDVDEAIEADGTPESDKIEDVDEDVADGTEGTREITKTEQADGPASAARFTWHDGGVSVLVLPSSGAFPGGTQMHVVRVSAQSLIDAAVKSGMEEIVDAVAVDITFQKDGQEIQPKGDVQVILRTFTPVEGDSFQAVTMDDDGEVEALGQATQSTAVIETDHFTVYGIVGGNYADDDVEEHVRYTYEFYAGSPETDRGTWSVMDTQIVREGDTLIAPPSPAESAGYLFAGWCLVDQNRNYLVDDQGRYIEAPFHTVTTDADEDVTIPVYARYDRFYQVTLYTDEEQRIVYETISVRDGTDVDLPTAKEIEEEGLPVADGSGFAGWINAAGPDGVTVASVTVNGADIDLYPTFYSTHRVTFVSDTASLLDEGIQESFINRMLPSFEIRDQYVAEGDKAKCPLEIKTGDVCNCYKFTGWYKKYEIGSNKELVFSDLWDFDNDTIGEDITLYAGWELQSAEWSVDYYLEDSTYDNQSDFTKWYTVPESYLSDVDFQVGKKVSDYLDKVLLYYNSQKLTGAANAADGHDSADSTRHYHLGGEGRFDGGSEHVAIEVWQSGNLLSTYDAGTGTWGNPDAVIGNTGKIEYRVYLCRDSYTLKVRYNDTNASVSSENIQGQEVGGELATNYRSSVTEQCYDISNLDFRVHEGQDLYSTIYRDPRIAELADSGWKFTRYYGDNTSGGQQTFSDRAMDRILRVSSANVMDGADILLTVEYISGMLEHPFVYRYYKPDGSLHNEITEKVRYDANSTNPCYCDIKLGEEDDGYALTKITGYDTDNSNPGNGKYCFTYDSNGNACEMVLHYVPVPYHITFHTGDGEESISATNGAWPTVTDQTTFYSGDDYSHVVAQEGVKNYEVGKTVRKIGGVYKVFTGWFESSACEGDPYSFIDRTMPAADLNFYAGWIPLEVDVVFHPENGDYETVQSVLMGSGVNRIENPEKDREVFCGWFLDEECTKPYDFDIVLTQETIADLKAEINESMVDNTIHLYAKWHSAIPYTIRYEWNGGTATDTLKSHLNDNNEDVKGYREGAAAPIRGAAKKDGYVFTGWKVKGAEYESDPLLTNTVAVHAANDAADGEKDHTIILVAQYKKTEHDTTVTYCANYPDRDDTERTESFKQEIINGDIVVKSPADADVGFGWTYTASDGSQYRFVCWTNTSGEKIFSDNNEREYFYVNETAAAGTDRNMLYAVWEVIINDVPNEPEPEPEPAPKPAPEPEPASKPASETEPTPETQPKSEANWASEHTPRTISESDSASDPDPDSEHNANPGPGPETKPDRDPKSMTATAAPNTGDDSQIDLWAAICAACLAAAALSIRKKERCTRNTAKKCR